MARSVEYFVMGQFVLAFCGEVVVVVLSDQLGAGHCIGLGFAVWPAARCGGHGLDQHAQGLRVVKQSFKVAVFGFTNKLCCGRFT